MECPLRVSNVVWVIALFAVACGSETGVDSADTTPDETSEAVAASGDPMDVIPEDIRLWDAFDAKLIIKQPDTNTLVVEGEVEGDAAERATEMETTAKEDGWETDVFTTHEGLATLILEKEGRRLKVNFTQDDKTVGVYLTTRLPE